MLSLIPRERLDVTELYAKAILVNSFQDCLDLLHPVDGDNSFPAGEGSKDNPMNLFSQSKALTTRTDIRSLLSHIRFNLIHYESCARKLRNWDCLCYNVILMVKYFDPYAAGPPVTLTLMHIMDAKCLFAPLINLSSLYSVAIRYKGDVMKVFLRYIIFIIPV